MKYAEMILITIAAAVAWNPARASAEESSRVRTLPQQMRLVSDQLQNVLAEKRGEFRDSAWPHDIEKIRVDKERVPDEVLKETNQWLKMMIKGKYLPQDPNSWLIPVRKPRPGFYEVKTDPNGAIRKTHIPGEGVDDYFVARYSIDRFSLEIQEGRGAVHLLIDVNDPAFLNSKTEQFLTTVLYEFLNYPEGQKGTLSFSIESSKHNAQMIWSGVVSCNFDTTNSAARAKRTWWNHTSVWTDGRRVYLSLVELSGEPQSMNMATSKPGYPPRFK
jgi:hypothetical protein